MKRHFENFLYGVGSVMDIAPPVRMYRLNNAGFAMDAARLRGDFASVGKDMRKQIKREQANYRTR